MRSMGYHGGRNYIAYEADPRQAEIAIRTLGLEWAKSVAAPGVKHEVIQEEDDPLLNSGDGTLSRRIAACYNLPAQYRVDIQYATKDIMKSMANPRGSDTEKPEVRDALLLPEQSPLHQYMHGLRLGRISYSQDVDIKRNPPAG